MLYESGLDLRVEGATILWLGDSDDEHNLVVRANDILVDSFRLRVDGPSPLIIHLQRGPWVALSFSWYDDIIR